MASGNRKITDIFSPKPNNGNKSSSSNSIKPTASQSTLDPRIEPSSSQSLPDVSPQVVQFELSKEIPFRPPKSYVFPKTKVGERNRSCQHQWFEKFPWLHYDSM